MSATARAAAETVAVRVESLSGSGEGVARLPDGRVLFVPRTAPGDEVRARPTVERRRWARAELLSVERAGPARREAPCPLYDRCGGCSLQHVAYAEQLAWKGRFVREALRRIGGLEVPVPTVRPSPSELRYRNRMTFTLRRLRGGRVVAGLREHGAPARVLDVAGECLLPEEPLLEAWTALRAAWGPGARRLPAGGRLGLTLRTAGGGTVLVVQGGEHGWDGGGLRDDVPGLLAVWHRPSGADTPRRVAGSDPTERRGEDSFTLAADAFVQVNRAASGPLVEHVLAAVGDPPPRGIVVDAYSGVGVYGRALARSGWRVTAIEADPHACAAARDGAPESLDVLEGRVEALLPGTLPADVLVVNPPRTGLADGVPEQIVAGRPGRVVYASCDPATLARDAARLTRGYRVADVAAFDLFPQTAHVETVAVFEADGGDEPRAGDAASERPPAPERS